jgi:hypothetical protein
LLFEEVAKVRFADEKGAPRELLRWFSTHFPSEKAPEVPFSFILVPFFIQSFFFVQQKRSQLNRFNVSAFTNAPLPE